MTHTAPRTPLSVSDRAALDDRLSNRFIALDPGGYFLIAIDPALGVITAQHFTNTIDDRGLACDPETGEPLPCTGKLQRQPTRVYTGRTAKELCIALFEANVEANSETEAPCPVTQLDHAAYLGREFVRAETALQLGQPYIQD